MKKGLLTLLAASLVFVGCQNYDDQFDDLNAQISALKSQVDGLSALSSQVSSLSGTISGLQAGISAAQAAAAAAGTSADAATAAATAAGTNAVAAAAAAEAAAAEAATAAAAATTAATTAGADAVAAAAEAAAAATAAGETAAAAAAAAEAAATAAGASAVDAAELATAAAEAAGADAVAAAAEAAAAATAAGETATAAAAAAEAAATAAGADAVAAAALAEAAADAATAAAAANTTSLTTLSAAVDALAADLAAVQASIATVSTAAEVAALQAEIDAIEADLEDLLNTSNVYQGNVEIASVNDLNTFTDLGNAINIVNGNVDIDVTATMDMDELQAVINKIFTVNGNFAYTDVAEDAGTVAADLTAGATFDLLTSVENLTLENVESVSAATLTTAEVITITESEGDNDGDADTADAGMMTSLSMPLLASATSITVGAANTIGLGDSGTSIDINSMDAFGTANALTIATAEGGSLTAAALTTPLAAAGTHDFVMTVSGLASFTAPDGVTGGTLNISDVPTVSVDTFQGTIDVGTGVTSLTVVDGSSVDIADADELVSATVDGAAQGATNAAYDEDAVAAAMSNNFAVVAANSDLTDLTLSGSFANVTITGSSVVSVTISATMNVLNISTSDDMTSLDVSDATIGNITLNDNDALASLTLDATANTAGTDADGETGVDIVVTNNDDLESLTVASSGVETLTVTDNSTLGAIDFSETTTLGTGTVAVTIDSNDLNATSIVETDATAGTGTTDAGTSGMDTLSDLLAAIVADLDSTADIRFDSAETISDEDGELNNGNDISYSNGAGDDAYLVVLSKDAGSEAGDDTSPGTQQTAFGVVAASGESLSFTLNGVAINFGDMSGTAATDVATILASAAIDTALEAGAVASAKVGYNSSTSVTMTLVAAGRTTLYGERYSTAAAMTAASTDTGNVYGVGKGDLWTIEVGDESATASLDADDTGSASNLAAALVAAWDGEIVDLAIADANSSVIEITANASSLDSESYNLAVSLSVSDSTTASSATSAAVDYIIGDTRLTSDNSTETNGFLVTFTSTESGSTNNTIVTLVDNSSEADVTALTDVEDGTTDMETGSDSVAGDAADDGLDTDRTGWL